MKFKFPFETLLRHRKHLENAAQRAYYEAQVAVDTCLNSLNEMYNSIENAREEISILEKNGGPTASFITTIHDFISGQKIVIDHKKDEARKLMKIAEDRYDELIEASKDHKILKKLKVKRFETYKKKLKKIEEKIADEVVTLRFKRGT